MLFVQLICGTCNPNWGSMEKHGIVYTHLGREGGRPQPKILSRGWGVINLTMLPDFDQVTQYVVAGQIRTQDVGGINVTQLIYFLIVKCLFLLDIIFHAAYLFTCLLLVFNVMSKDIKRISEGNSQATLKDNFNH